MLTGSVAMSVYAEPRMAGQGGSDRA
jgi:hypothetical protein